MIFVTVSDTKGLGVVVVAADSIAEAAEQIRARYAELGDGFAAPAELGVLVPHMTATVTPGSPPTLALTGSAQNQKTLLDRAEAALAANATYLALPAIPAVPTNAQLIAAVKAIRDQTDALTKETNALIRLLLGQLDTVAGT